MIRTIDSRFYKRLGMQLKDIRHDKGLSLRDMQKKIGFSRTLIDRWELGKAKIKPEQYKILCDALNVDSNFEIEIKLHAHE